MTTPFPIDSSETAPMIILGGGIVGLTLALTLHQQLAGSASRVEIYEKAPDFGTDVGAGMGMYSNGLRVIRDVSPDLLDHIRANGCPFVWRRFHRHDGTEIMAASESILHQGDEALESIGIRRWRLLNVLYQEVQRKGIPVYFKKRVNRVQTVAPRNRGSSPHRNQKVVQVHFTDGTFRQARIVFAADGSKSVVRGQILKNLSLSHVDSSCNKKGDSDNNTQQATENKLHYTGVTCVMGLAENSLPIPEDFKGISCPSGYVTKCHAAYFPVSSQEQCFQIYFRVPREQADPGNWGTLSDTVGMGECQKLADMLREHGWDERYITPLEEMTRAVRIGFCELQPSLEQWVFTEVSLPDGDQPNGPNGLSPRSAGNGGCRIVLVGDAAHPPVPYTGQGAQMGLEDAGTLALLLKEYCCDSDGTLDMDEDNYGFLEQFDQAMELYQQIRIPRVKHIQNCSNDVGRIQELRAASAKHDVIMSEKLQRHVFFHETLPQMLPGAHYDYKKDVERAIRQAKRGPPPLPPVQE